MNEKANKNHWENWAKTYKKDLRATTKSRTIKEIEIQTIINSVKKYYGKEDAVVLECGCGNGINLIEVAKAFPHFRCVGFDFVPAMVENANINKAETEKNIERRLDIEFQVGDLRAPENLGRKFDIIFTNRAIINLANREEQRESLYKLVQMLEPDGILILLENGIESYARQNDLRDRLGLQKRTPAEFNVFLDEQDILSSMKQAEMHVRAFTNVGSLHDIILYVLLPKMMNGADHYNHPIVDLAKQLELQNISEDNSFGKFGQLNLFVFQKTSPR